MDYLVRGIGVAISRQIRRYSIRKQLAITLGIACGAHLVAHVLNWLADRMQAAERERRAEALVAKYRTVVQSEPVSFVAGNGPLIVRTAGMTDAEWAAVVRREAGKRA